jgi:uncharacterized membrane protein SpoIIM required for sporulation
MIIDLERFIANEQPYWDELQATLTTLEQRTGHQLDLDAIKRFNYLYQRTASDLARISTFSAEPTTRRYLENLVARAYAEIHEARQARSRFQFGPWALQTFPQTFRRHIRAFQMTVLVTMIGCVFGALVVATDAPAKGVILPFDHLHGSPSDRVAEEESVTEDRMKGHRSEFSAQLMANNIRVSITALALGITWGLGTLVLLFYNGVILGAVALDYVLSGETVFLLGWLLPHGSIEIPAILLAGQAGLVLAHALIGFGSEHTLRERFRLVSPDLVTLIAGVAIMLIWAGLIEAFFSQYHEPFLPYSLKIAFGATELVLLCIYLARVGRDKKGSVRANAALGAAGANS